MTSTDGSIRRLRPSAPDPLRWRMLPVILIGTFMSIFDNFVVNVAAPSIRGDLGVGSAALELIIGGYAFTYASGMITAGRLGDLHGYRKMFGLGMAGFALTSLLCGIAQQPGELIVFRLLQGAAGAMMVPQVLALINNSFSAAERPRALTWFGVTIGVASVAGQVLGGLLLDADLFGLGWRVIFLINVPIGIATLLAVPRLLPRISGTARPRLDPAGAIGIAGALALALVPLVLGRSTGWPAWAIVSLIASVPALVAVLLWERRLHTRDAEPAIDVSLLRHRHFSAGLVVNVAMMGSFASFMFVLTLVLQSGLGMSPLGAGLTFGPLGAVFAISSVLGRPLFARYGSLAITAGAGISALGFAGLLVAASMSGPQLDPARLAVPFAAIGLGNGLAMPSLIGAVLSGIHPRRAGSAAGMLTTAQQFAGALGIAVLGGVFFGSLGHATGATGFVAALRPTVLIDLVLMIGSAGLSLLLPRGTATGASTTAAAGSDPVRGERARRRLAA